MRTNTCVRYQLLLSALTPEWFRHNLLTSPTHGLSNSTQNLLVLRVCYSRTETHIADFARNTPYKRQETRTQMHPACSPLASDFSRPLAQTRVVAPSRAEESVCPRLFLFSEHDVINVKQREKTMSNWPYAKHSYVMACEKTEVKYDKHEWSVLHSGRLYHRKKNPR